MLRDDIAWAPEDEVAAATDQRATPQPVRLTGHRPHSAAAAGHLRHTIGFVRTHALSDPAIAEQPLVRATVSQLLAGSVLAAFPNTALIDPTAPDRNDAHPGTLQRALSHIDDHADQPLTVADIAAAAHISSTARPTAGPRAPHCAADPPAAAPSLSVPLAARMCACGMARTGPLLESGWLRHRPPMPPPLPDRKAVRGDREG
ncbi:hypothetical protein [Streptomyces antimycoticus]|uniref:hypothetical protein n=1 Tax=Streptomyces antimycoticus TaxID=68175 RepID=UPI002570A355|nr:hypothetical protein [Streptomyces antimycoticus]WJD97951.1 hypothetical protein QR300_19185 [Streptomyces antimycoticus]